MKPIPTDLLKRYLAGDFRLPAGAIPLVEIHDGWVICQTAHGYWIRFSPLAGDPVSLPNSIQKQVIVCLIEAFGGMKAMAKRLNVSTRTIEAWRSGRATLPLKAADDIAHLLP